MVDLPAPVLKAAETVSGGVKVTWNAVSGSPSYRIYRKIPGETYKAIGHATGTSFTDTSVTAGTTYVYTVRCETADGKALLSGYDSAGKSVQYVG